MTNLIKFTPRAKPEPVMPVVADNQNLHIKEAGVYTLETVAVGVEIAMILRGDREAAKFLMQKMQQAVNQGTIDVVFTLQETRKYLDYLDILESPVNQSLRAEVSRFKFGVN